jgi:hypothetical protein
MVFHRRRSPTARVYGGWLVALAGAHVNLTSKLASSGARETIQLASPVALSPNRISTLSADVPRASSSSTAAPAKAGAAASLIQTRVPPSTPRPGAISSWTTVLSSTAYSATPVGPLGMGRPGAGAGVVMGPVPFVRAVSAGSRALCATSRSAHRLRFRHKPCVRVSRCPGSHAKLSWCQG